MSKCIIHTNAGLTSVTQVLSREKNLVTAAVVETVITPAVTQPQTITAADGSVKTETVIVSPEHSREQEVTPAVYRDETEDEALARVIATMAAPTLVLPLSALPAGGPETWAVDYATGIVSIRALTPEQLRTLLTAECTRRIDAAIRGKRGSMNTEAARLLQIIVMSGSLTADEQADVVMLKSIQEWDYAMVEARETAITAGTLVADVVWPTPPAGLAAFLAGY